MLEKILKGRVGVIDKVKDWEEAIKIASKPLIDDMSITSKYVDAMINNIKKYGTYIIVAPKVAMPHSRPEDGVNKNALALLKINEGVIFDEEEEKINLIFILGAVDNSSHIETLTELMNILDDEEKIEKLIKAKSINEIMESI